MHGMTVDKLREMANVLEALNATSNASHYRFPGRILVMECNGEAEGFEAFGGGPAGEGGEAVGELVWWYGYGYRFETL